MWGIKEQSFCFVFKRKFRTWNYVLSYTFLAALPPSPRFPKNILKGGEDIFRGEGQHNYSFGNCITKLPPLSPTTWKFITKVTETQEATGKKCRRGEKFRLPSLWLPEKRKKYIPTPAAHGWLEVSFRPLPNACGINQSRLCGPPNQTWDLLEFSQSNTRFRRKIMVKTVSAILRTGVVRSDILLNCFIAWEVNYKVSLFVFCYSDIQVCGRSPSIPSIIGEIIPISSSSPFFRHIPRIRAYYPTTNRAGEKVLCESCKTRRQTRRQRGSKTKGEGFMQHGPKKKQKTSVWLI